MSEESLPITYLEYWQHAVKQDQCPRCGGELDTGWECNLCEYDAKLVMFGRYPLTMETEMTITRTIYESGVYANTKTEVKCDPTLGPGMGRHRYLVTHSTVDRSGPDSLAALEISFQCHPVNTVGVNGIQDEGLLMVLIDRLRAFQDGPFKCRENALALTKLEEAFHWMEERKRDRIIRTVEGTLQK